MKTFGLLCALENAFSPKILSARASQLWMISYEAPYDLILRPHGISNSCSLRVLRVGLA